MRYKCLIILQVLNMFVLLSWIIASTEENLSKFS